MSSVRLLFIHSMYISFNQFFGNTRRGPRGAVHAQGKWSVVSSIDATDGTTVGGLRGTEGTVRENEPRELTIEWPASDSRTRRASRAPGGISQVGHESNAMVHWIGQKRSRRKSAEANNKRAGSAPVACAEERVGEETEREKEVNRRQSIEGEVIRGFPSLTWPPQGCSMTLLRHRSPPPPPLPP
jgi:hypothetical protein